MKRCIATILVLFSLGLAAHSAEPSRLTSLQAISNLNNTEADRALPVTFEATITYFRPYEQSMFVQDGRLGIYVQADTQQSLVPGDRVLVRGETLSGLRPFVRSSDFVLLHHGTSPRPIEATFSELITSERDCLRVLVRGVIRTADWVSHSDVRAGNHPVFSSLRLQILTDGGVVEAFVDSGDVSGLRDLLDAEVEVVGVAGGRFDGKLEQTGVVIHVSTADDLKILKRADGSPWNIPVTPMEKVLHSYNVIDLTGRVRVHGTITYYEPGAAAVLQDGSKSLWLSTQRDTPMTVGDLADATGFPDAHNGFLTLNFAEVEDRGIQTPITPQPVKWAQLVESNKLFDLVSIEGKVVTENRETGQDEYVISSEGHLFTAISRHTIALRHIFNSEPPMKAMLIGSRVRVTGICILEDSNPFSNKVPFDILLRSDDDIVMVARPSLLNVRNLARLVGLLLLIVFGVTLRGWSLEHRVRRETAVAATVERQRSRVLEDINRARPLAEIIVQVTELLTYKLNGAPCWCRLADGTTLGDSSQVHASFRRHVIEYAIPSHSGETLGTIYAGIDPRSRTGAAGLEALFNAAQLAALAIETGGLYSDLVHRSEFDMLTEIYNRFSMEKRVDALIEGDRRNDGAFGLIYIDLDEFKLVNDRYGHGAGDGYLKEVAVRMNRQLRPGDMLARLGGDEFAVVVADVRDDANVKEITLRLKRCFDETFVVAGNLIRGSASVGLAIYPKDGTTRNALLSVADAVMYEAKRIRHQLPVSLIHGPI